MVKAYAVGQSMRLVNLVYFSLPAHVAKAPTRMRWARHMHTKATRGQSIRGRPKYALGQRSARQSKFIFLCRPMSQKLLPKCAWARLDSQDSTWSKHTRSAKVCAWSKIRSLVLVYFFFAAQCRKSSYQNVRGRGLILRVPRLGLSQVKP